MQKTKLYQQKIRNLLLALGLLCVFFAIELGMSLWIHSLSLMADAGHILSDIATLGLTLFACWIGQKANPYRLNSNRQSRYRVEIWAALLNSLSLILLESWVVAEAIARLAAADAEILSLPMLVTALIGLAVDGWNAKWLHACSHQDLNCKAALLHVLADLLSSLGVIVASIAIAWLDWQWADGAVSLIVAGIAIVSAIPLVMQSILTLMGKITPDNCICDRDRQDLERLLYPSLEEIVR
jgi:cobalt-zinc-cadmium efflux system protein